MTKRDNIFNEDWVLVALDSYNDKQSAYGFAVNPLGVQGDIMMNSDGNGDASQDFIWDSAAKITDNGYIVEIAIPLQSLRFNNDEKVEMGVAFIRRIPRHSEQAAFPAFHPGKGGMTSQMGDIEYQGLKYKPTYEILPSVTANHNKTIQKGVLNHGQFQKNIGVTTKIGLTSTLTLDATLNPDFSQVEADAAQVTANLRSNVYYEEKRPFFLEGSERFHIAGTNGGSAIRKVVHTRTIIDPLGGLKLSGKLGKSNAISGIIAADESPDPQAGHNAYFGILRYKRLLNGENYVGGIYSSRFFQDSYNQVTGIDAKFRLSGTMSIQGNSLYALNRAVDKAHQSKAHNTDLRWTYSSDKYYTSLGLHDISKNFNLETGFVPRDGVRALVLSGRRNFYPQSDFFKRISPGTYSFVQYDKYDHQSEYFVQLSNNINLPRNTYLFMNYQFGTETYAGKLFDRKGYHLYLTSQVTKGINLSMSFGRRGTPWYDPDNPFQGEKHSIYASMDFKPTENFTTSLRLIRSFMNRTSTGEQLFDYRIYRNRTTYQLNKYFYVRATLEYNDYEKTLMTDLLAAFTYIPGTVIYVGYGSLYEKTQYCNTEYIPANDFLEMQRGFFVKASYNWRL